VRVEAVHCRPVAAGCHVFGDVALGDRGVGGVGGRVEAFAEVEQVRGVEVVQAEVFGEGV
jgi:hypothetical protein